MRPPWNIAVGFVVLGSMAGAARADEVEKPKTDLIDVVHRAPLGCALDRWRVRPYGWVEASLSTTPGLNADERTARVFDVERDGFRLHQAYLALERTPADDRCFDLGGKVAVLWGTDARLLHARGLLDDQDGDDEQFDLLEAKLLARFSVAHGLTVMVGKCTTPLGFEVIEAPNDSWTTALNADVGSEQGAAPGGGDARWWGVAGYVTRKFSDRVSGTVRAEWFRDEDGTRLGQEASLGEVTLGANWTPNECLPNLHLRPEIRWDHSFDGALFDAGRDEDQLSLTFNVVSTF